MSCLLVAMVRTNEDYLLRPFNRALSLVESAPIDDSGTQIARWIPDMATVFKGVLILWLGAASVAIGWLVYHVSIQSQYSIYRVASIPLLLTLLIAMVVVFRLQSSHVPVLLLIAAAFLPLSLPTGTDSRLVDSLILTIVFAGVWFVRGLVTERKLHLAPSPVNRPLVAFCAVTVVSLGWGILVRDPMVHAWSTFTLVQLASTAVMIMLPAAFLMAASYIRNTSTLKLMVVLMLAAGLLGLPKQFDLVNLPINTGGLFTMWVVTLSIGMAIFYRRLAWWMRAALGLLGAVWIYWGFIVHVAWLAGWLPGLFAVGLLVFLRSKKLFAVLLLAALVYLLPRQTYYLNTVVPNEENQSLYSRLDAWATNWSITKDHLLLGTGPAGYAAYYISYFPTRAMASHSNFIDILSQTGVVGLGLLLWFFYELLRVGFRLRKLVLGRGDFVEALTVSALAGSAGAIMIMGFGDWVIPFAYTQTIAGFDHAIYTWLFMGTIIALSRIVTAGQEKGAVGLSGSEKGA